MLLRIDSKERTEEEEKIILFRVYFLSSYNISKIMALTSCNEAEWGEDPISGGLFETY